MRIIKNLSQKPQSNTMHEDTETKASGIMVSINCIASLALIISLGDTGRDLQIQKALPSNDIEGATISFIVLKMQITPIAITVKGSPTPSFINASCNLAPFMNIKTAIIGIRKTPIPQLSIYCGLDANLENSFERRAINWLFAATFFSLYSM